MEDKIRVFISYRRDGADIYPDRLQESLSVCGFDVFLDTESMRPGPFDTQIYAQIDACSTVLLLLPPDALARCKNEGDWLRLEIAHALKKQKFIIPLMMEGFGDFPADLPADIADVRRYEGRKINRENWKQVIAWLDGAIREAAAQRIVTVRCPKCGAVFQRSADDLAAQCNACGEVFLLPHAAQPDGAPQKMPPRTAPETAHAEFSLRGNVLTRYHGRGGTVRVPSGATKIAEAAFMGCTNVTAVMLPASLTEIGRCAFHGCTGLTEIVLPQNLSVLTAYAFCECKSLQRVRFMRTPSVIGEGAFEDCAQLTAVAFPLAFAVTCDTGGVEIGRGVFRGTPLEAETQGIFRYFK